MAFVALPSSAAWRHRDAVVLVHGLAVRRAAALCDPGAGTGTHDRLHRGDQPACGPAADDPAVLVLVDIRLAVGDDDDLVGREVVPQQRAQALGAPLRPLLGLFAARAVDLSQKALQIAQQRTQPRAVARGKIDDVGIGALGFAAIHLLGACSASVGGRRVAAVSGKLGDQLAPCVPGILE